LRVGDVPGPASWLRPYETKSGRYYKQPELAAAHGLSIFGSRDEIDQARRLVPNMARKSLAEFRVELHQGKALNTPSAEGASHHDWWTDPEDLTPVAVVVEETLVP
jgi:hypothetical protein